MAYHLEGRLLEVCTCKAFCPCWVGEDPDNGTCDGLLAWHIEKGTTDGVDVGGLTIGGIAHIPGNVLEGNWRIGRPPRRARDQGAGAGVARGVDRQLSAPLGIGLNAWGALIVLQHTAT
jgi:hypothetical protein